MTYGRRETIAAALLRNNEASQLKTDEDRTTGASRYRSRAMRLSTARRPRNKSWEAVERRRTEETADRNDASKISLTFCLFIFRFLLERHFRHIASPATTINANRSDHSRNNIILTRRRRRRKKNRNESKGVCFSK